MYTLLHKHTYSIAHITKYGSASQSVLFCFSERGLTSDFVGALNGTGAYFAVWVALTHGNRTCPMQKEAPLSDPICVVFFLIFVHYLGLK